MLGMLIAYDAAGNVVATLDYLIQYDLDKNPIGLVNFCAHETGGGEMTDYWRVSNAVGSKAWPEWLGGRAHEYRVERGGPAGRTRITALVHKTSGARRERDTIDRAIAARVEASGGRDVDLRDLLGGPDRPLT